MKKQIIIIIILIAIIIPLAIFFDLDKIKDIFNRENTKIENNKFKDLEKNLGELDKDVEFYKHFDLYLSLSDDKKYNQVKEKIDNFWNESKELENLFMLIVVNELFKDEETKNIVNELKKDVYEYKKLTKEEENEIFEKNNSCAILITSITEQLSNKYKNTDSKITEKEELDFIFYSPKMKTCLYSTEYSYNYIPSFLDYKNDYKDYWYSSKIVYNASTNAKINEYKTYYSLDYPLIIDKEESEKETERNKKNYTKFILENSNYNIELLKDMSIF